MQREKMTPRSVILDRQSRMTLTFHFAWNASRLFSQLKSGRDRQEERGKTKIELFWGETGIWIPGETPIIFLDTFWLAKPGEDTVCDSLFNDFPLYVLMSDGQQSWVLFKNILFSYMREYSTWVFAGGIWRGGGWMPWVLWVSRYPPTLPSLHCLSPLTCPVACRPQTGAG